MAKNNNKNESGFSNKELLYIGFLYVVQPYIMNFVTFLTRFFPFPTLINDTYYFHYKNREYVAAKNLLGYDRLLSRRLFIIESQERDDYFYTILGKFEKSSKAKDLKQATKRLYKRFGEGSVYINELGEEVYKIQIKRAI